MRHQIDGRKMLNIKCTDVSKTKAILSSGGRDFSTINCLLSGMYFVIRGRAGGYIIYVSTFCNLLLSHYEQIRFQKRQIPGTIFIPPMHKNILISPINKRLDSCIQLLPPLKPILLTVKPPHLKNGFGKRLAFKEILLFFTR